MTGKSSAGENKGPRRKSRPQGRGRSGAKEGRGQRWPVLAQGPGILEVPGGLGRAWRGQKPGDRGLKCEWSETETGSVLSEGWGARRPEVAWNGRRVRRRRARREKDRCWCRLHVSETRVVCRYKGRTDQALKTWKFAEIWSFLIVIAKAVFIGKIFRVHIQTHRQHSLPPPFK